MSKSLSVEALLAQADGALDALAGVELAPGDVAGALDLARRVEVLGRRVRAVQVDVVAAVDESGLYRGDGHASARVMVELASRLSPAEAKRRDRARRMLASMPAVRAGLESGSIGVCQVDRIALVFVNPRVQEQFVALDEQIAVLAQRLPYPEFDRRLTNWVRQVDEDGTADRARRCHDNRRARLVQDFDGGWELLCLVGGLSGAQMKSVFEAFVEAEFAADWAEARAVHGDATTVEHLARSYDQRDADAVVRIFELAANAWAASPGGAPIDTTIVMDHETFERELRRAAPPASPSPRGLCPTCARFPMMPLRLILRSMTVARLGARLMVTRCIRAADSGARPSGATPSTRPRRSPTRWWVGCAGRWSAGMEWCWTRAGSTGSSPARSAKR